MIVAMLMGTAAATPVDRGLQVQIAPDGFDFVSAQLAGTEFAFGPRDIHASWECYHTLDVYDFNLDLPIDSVELQPGNGTLGVVVELGEVRGENMRIEGTSGWVDLCIDFDADLEYIELSGGRLEGELQAEVVGGVVQLSFVAPPVVSGEMDSDINWFPDDLVWAFMETTILEMIADTLAETVPSLVSDLTAGGMSVAEVGGVPVVAIVDDVEATSDGLFAAIDVDLDGDGEDRGQLLDLTPRGRSHVGVGLTEGMAEEVLGAAWAEGLLSPDSDLTASLLDSLISGLGLEGTEISLSVEGVPSVEVDPEGIHLSLPETTLVAQTEDGERALELVADVTGWLEAGLSNGGILLTAHELELEVRELDASLVEGDAENVQRFLEGWVVQAATAAMGELEVYQSNFEVLGYVLRLDEAEAQDGGMVVWMTLFDADDPEVDREAPDTEVTASLTGSTLNATFDATDDRPGALLFAWQLDDGGWSRWSTEATLTVEVEPGDHTLQVISRDLWYNADGTPAVTTLSLEEAPAEEPKKGCGCAASPTGLAGGWLVALGALVARRRR